MFKAKLFCTNHKFYVHKCTLGLGTVPCTFLWMVYVFALKRLYYVNLMDSSRQKTWTLLSQIPEKAIQGFSVPPKMKPDDR